MWSCLTKSSVINPTLAPTLAPALLPLISSNPTLAPALLPLIASNPILAPALIPLIASNPTLAPAITLALLPTIMPALVPALERNPSILPALTKVITPLIINTITIKEELYSILCDNSGMIQDVSPDMLLLLKCEIDTIKGKFIGSIMSLYISMIHKKKFIGNFNTCGTVERNILENKLKRVHRKRPFLIYDIEGGSHAVGMSLIYNKCPFSSLKNPFITTSINLSKQFYLTFDLIDEPLDLFYTYIPMEKDGVFTESKSKVVVICIDFIDSTATLISQGGSLLSIDNSIKFHKEIVNLIRNVYYPFIYLHEVIGDSFIIALNTDWAYTSNFFCASLAISFIFDLVHNTKHFVEIRTGVAYGTLHYGTIGATFRFFGKPINMASRLENKCLVNEIIICKDFYNKLISCMEYISTTIHKTEIIKQSINLKGFGDTECYKINIPEKGTFISYNNN